MMPIADIRILFVACLLGTIEAPPSSGERLQSCLTADCHAEYGRRVYAHAPVAKGVCRICHRVSNVERHEFRLARDGRGLCSVCHPEVEAARSVHNEVWRQDCTICHDPHGTDQPFLIPAKEITGLCEGCHPEVIAGRGVLHTPVATEPCTVCHDPHVSRSRTGAGERNEVCLRCHEETRRRLEEPARVHEPLRSGGCEFCHDPHGSEAPANLRRSVPDLCYQCHEETRRKVESAEHQHSVAGAPGGCVVCHDPHASTMGFGLRSDPMTLCRDCHAIDVIKEDGDTVSAVAHQIESSRFLHGPVRERDCAGCHDSHGSDHFRILIANYSPTFYARFDPEHYALCFTCHPQRKVLTEKTTDLTGFRNGDSNLHWLHVTRPANGRTCRACHATHGSNQPKHIRESVRFGQWDLPITFVKTATGGRCESGCHVPREYDRERPVEYAGATAPPDGKGER